MYTIFKVLNIIQVVKNVDISDDICSVATNAYVPLLMSTQMVQYHSKSTNNIGLYDLHDFRCSTVQRMSPF